MRLNTLEKLYLAMKNCVPEIAMFEDSHLVPRKIDGI
jgi:hypothetical protein